MAYHLKMVKINAIKALHQQGWSQRRIAELLGIHRETVARHLRNASAEPAPAAPASEPENRPQAPPGPPASRSECEPYRAEILGMLEQGLSAQRIYQDLRELGDVSYYSVRRFVAS